LLHSEGLEKGQGHRVLDPFGAFRLLLGGRYTRTAPTRKIRNLSHFLKVYWHSRTKIFYYKIVIEEK